MDDLGNAIDEAFEELMNNSYNDYWIVSGKKSYQFKEDIVSWGGYWVNKDGYWRIDQIGEDSMAYKALTKLGLILSVIYE